MYITIMRNYVSFYSILTALTLLFPIQRVSFANYPGTVGPSTSPEYQGNTEYSPPLNSSSDIPLWSPQETPYYGSQPLPYYGDNHIPGKVYISDNSTLEKSDPDRSVFGTSMYRRNPTPYDHDINGLMSKPRLSSPNYQFPTTSITPGYPNYDRWPQQTRQGWGLHILPDGLIYPSYLAGPKESRLAATWNYERDLGWIWDASAGGRAGIFRYGSKNGVLPEGIQLDVEGAGLVRIDYENDLDLIAADFRCGFPLTFGTQKTQYKIAYYHLSSHLGDEYMLRPDARDRVNYVRDSLVLAISHRICRDIRIYGEVAYAFFVGEKTEPWEFQFGIEYSPVYPSNRECGAPFFAINGHLFQELDFSGNMNLQVGWQWRGTSNHLFRIGVQYFCGSSDQFEFNDLYESKLGLGIWYDF